MYTIYMQVSVVAMDKKDISMAIALERWDEQWLLKNLNH